MKAFIDASHRGADRRQSSDDDEPELPHLPDDVDDDQAESNCWLDTPSWDDLDDDDAAFNPEPNDDPIDDDFDCDPLPDDSEYPLEDRWNDADWE